MDVDTALGIIEKTDYDYLIKRRFARGVAILLTLCDEYDDLDARFGHDQIWIGDFEQTVKKMDKATVRQMARLGWFEAEGAWSHF